MYAYIKGTIQEVTPDSCVIEAGGIGYNIRISPSTAGKLAPIGSETKIYTYTAVREDAIQLVGFLKNSDLKMFRRLITVNGIGPKGGLSILSEMDADAVRFAILTGDVKSLSKAPGVGKKSAERIILELKGSMADDELPVLGTGNDISAPDTSAGPVSGAMEEAAAALISLGYSSGEAVGAVKKAAAGKPDMNVEDLLKNALKELY